MKSRLTLIFLLCILCSILSFAQGPTLNLVGSSPSLSKGNINTEVLTQIIQKKQEEIKQHVFRNTIVKSFNRIDPSSSRLKNFATYHMVYKLMDAMTSGKNKTVITKSIMEEATDFSYVYGMVLYYQYTIPKGVNIAVGNYKFTSDMTENAKAKTQPSNFPEAKIVSIPDTVNDFNFLIDLCYDILKSNPSLRKNFSFSFDDTDKSFSTWYDNDNVYLNAYKSNPSHQPAYDAFRIQLEAKMQEFATLLLDSKTVIDAFKMIVKGPDKKKKELAETLMKTLFDLSRNDSDTYGLAVGLTPSQIASLKRIIDAKDKNLLLIKSLISFYVGLEKSDFKEFTLTKDQYYALKYLTTDFMKLARNQFKNNVVSGVIDFLLQNTLIEYEEEKTSIMVAEEKVSSEDRGYLFIDIEAVVSAVYEHFVPTERKGKYFQFLFSLGTNQASFLNGNNKLSIDGQGQSKSLDQLYYASEKIGFKVKLYNWRYTHSFAPGEKFNYYRYKNTYWLRPQQKPVISDIHFIGYASGILYNLANLKSSDNFNYAIVGGGFGLTFFNGLAVTTTLACPFTDKSFLGKNMFFNLGIDIPIIEYISALSKK